MQENDKEGFVYILSNQSMLGLLKIGYSKNVSERVKQLSNTSIPTPFKCEYYIYSEDCVRLEKAVHSSLLFCRVNSDREFFKITLLDAIKCIYKEATQLDKDYNNSIIGLRDLLGCRERVIDTQKMIIAKNEVELLEKKFKIEEQESNIGLLLILLASLSPDNYRKALKDTHLEHLFYNYINKGKNNFGSKFHND